MFLDCNFKFINHAETIQNKNIQLKIMFCIEIQI